MEKPVILQFNPITFAWKEKWLEKSCLICVIQCQKTVSGKTVQSNKVNCIAECLDKKCECLHTAKKNYRIHITSTFYFTTDNHNCWFMMICFRCQGDSHKLMFPSLSLWGTSLSLTHLSDFKGILDTKFMLNICIKNHIFCSGFSLWNTQRKFIIFTYLNLSVSFIVNVFCLPFRKS